MARRCPNCGGRNLDAARFCVACGTPLEPAPPPTPLRAADSPSSASHAIVAAPPITLVPPRPLPARIPDGRAAREVGRPRGWARLLRRAPAPPPAEPPFRIHDDRRELTIPLLPRFRFVHEPVGLGDAAQFVGRRHELESLAERILFSEGGSFLVTGYRGVGKTSFVNQVVRKLGDALPWARPVLGETEIVDVYLNVARPVEPSEMMHHIIRMLHDRLVERGVYRHLDADLREEIALAYQRTSLNMARKLGESTERSVGLDDVGVGGGWLGLGGKLALGSKRGRSSEQQMAFLGYDDKAAEHDVIRIARRLARGYVPPTTPWRRARLAATRRPPSRVRLKIIFVFDELDKLEEFAPRRGKGDAAAKPPIDAILGALKNLFTTSGLTFVFVAGKDLQERWLEDVGRGDSVYESVFAYDKYLPCLWDDVAGICDALVDRSMPLGARAEEALDDFRQYLAYRGRGIPRRIIRAFNEHVEWDEGRPALAFTALEVRRFRFFAGLQALIESRRAALFGDAHEDAPGTTSDRRRLGVHYLIDWILGRGAAEFTLADVLAASRRLSTKVALDEEIAPGVAETILRTLVDADYVQALQPPTPLAVGTALAAVPTRYRVSPRRLVELGGQAAADLDAVFAMPPDVATAAAERPPAAVGRYRVLREIGRGGMGVVYEALDERIGMRVALKLLGEPQASDAELVARFEREGAVLEALDHPNVVRLLERGRADGRPFIAMELLDGVTLEEAIRRQGRLEPAVAAAVAAPVASALGHVHERGYVRNDVKPGNIVLTGEGRVCLLDFGISRPRSAEAAEGGLALTRAFAFVGTPPYMAPEQFSGPADERSDVYALGVVLYRMLAGEYPYAAADPPALMRAHAAGPPPPPSQRVPIPPALDALVVRCLAHDPEARFQGMAALEAALAEARAALPAVDLVAAIAELRDVARAIEALDVERTQEAPLAAPPPHAAPSPAVPSPAARPPTAAGPATAPPVAAPPGGAYGTPTWPPGVPTTPPPPPGELGAPPRPYLVLVEGDAGLVVTSAGLPAATLTLAGRTTLGRNSENDVVIRDTSVSRFQAVLAPDDGGWVVEDANSVVGTYVTGERVRGRRRLADGDEIRVGDFVFLFGAARGAGSA